MYKVLLFMAAWLILVSCSKEEGGAMPPIEEETIVFSYENGTFSGRNLPYRKAVIGGQPDTKAALVLYLHGGSSKGSDNEKPLMEAGVDSISNYLSSHAIRSIFLVPQCPADQSWGESMAAVLKSLVDEYASSGQIDTGRIYIFGGSMGGTGTWLMLSNYPGLFAAAMPVAGNPSDANLENVARTPLLTVMGTDDVIMDLEAVRDAATRLSSLGNVNRFEIEEGWTHEMVCVKSYTAERLDWVFDCEHITPFGG